jgi:hypothetical protein
MSAHRGKADLATARAQVQNDPYRERRVSTTQNIRSLLELEVEERLHGRHLRQCEDEKAAHRGAV